MRVVLPIVGRLGQGHLGDDRGHDEFLEALFVGDVVVERHRSSSQCRSKRPHTQRAQARLVDQAKGREGDLIGGEACPHVIPLDKYDVRRAV